MDEDEDDELERVAGVLAILEQAGVIILPDGSGEPGRDTALVAGEPDDTDPPLPGPRRERRAPAPADALPATTSGLDPPIAPGGHSRPR